MKLRTLVLATSTLLVASCHRSIPMNLAPSKIGMPGMSDIESVIFFVGDMGEADWERSTLPHRMASEVERWSDALNRDSSVAVVFLGDNVYPRGMRTEDPVAFPEDSTRLQAQVNILMGPRARAHKSFGVFIAGNHDWGHMPGARGEQRIRNQGDFLARRAKVANVSLMPEAGQPGPGVVDVGRHIRMLLFDTAWWLLSADREEKARTVKRMQDEMLSAEAKGREVIVASHHPFRSGSAHGGLVSFWGTIGVEWLLNRSGASLQDINSLPYRDLLLNMQNAFHNARIPLAYVGGHDHALQLLEAVQPDDPRFILVSGSGSKSSIVGSKEGMRFRSPDTGYMQMVVRKNGGVDLFIYSVPFGDSVCAPGAEQQACIQKGIGEYEAKYSLTMKR